LVYNACRMQPKDLKILRASTALATGIAVIISLIAGAGLIGKLGVVALGIFGAASFFIVAIDLKWAQLLLNVRSCLVFGAILIGMTFLGWAAWPESASHSLEPSDRAFLQLVSVTSCPNDTFCSNINLVNNGHLTVEAPWFGWVRMFAVGQFASLQEEDEFFSAETHRPLALEMHTPWPPNVEKTVLNTQAEFLKDDFFYNAESREMYFIFAAEYRDKLGLLYVERCFHSGTKDMSQIHQCLGHNQVYLERPAYWPKNVHLENDTPWLSRILDFCRKRFVF
jgi:hypothetical protein